jgi:hypothetical protein
VREEKNIQETTGKIGEKKDKKKDQIKNQADMTGKKIEIEIWLFSHF